MNNNIIFIVLGLVLLCWGYNIYVSVIMKKNKVMEAFSSIDVQLKKRYDLIPNMLHMASKFMEHEKSLMTELTELRTRAMQNTFVGSPQEKMELENMFILKTFNIYFNFFILECFSIPFDIPP